MEKEKLNKLYDYVLEDAKLTKSFFESIGFTETDVNELIAKGIVVPHYSSFLFLDADGLCHYGFEVEWNKNWVKANRCYKKALEINPCCEGASYLDVFQSLRGKNYPKAFEDLCAFKELDPHNAHFLLFLLTFSHEFDDSILDAIRPIYRRYFLNDYPYVEQDGDMDLMKKHIVSFQFKRALTCLNNVARRQGRAVSLRTKTYRILIHDAIDYHKSMRAAAVSYYRAGKMLELKTFLEFQTALDGECLSLLQLLKDYEEMFENNRRFSVFEGKLSWWQDAIRLRRYDVALTMLEEKLKVYESPSEVSLCVYDLLQKIIALQNQFSTDEPMKLTRKGKEGEENVE